MADNGNKATPPAPSKNTDAEQQHSLLPSAVAPPDRLPVHPDEPGLTADVEFALQGIPADERDAYLKEIQRIAKMRKSPFGSMSQKLALPVRPGYHRHWFNDVAGRIEEAEQNGWTKIKDKTGKIVRRVVGSGRDGGALWAFAMELPAIFFEREMKARSQAAQARMDEVQKNPIRAPAGQAQPSDRGKFYSPREEVISASETLAVRKRE
jgi:hypothetical protein